MAVRSHRQKLHLVGPVLVDSDDLEGIPRGPAGIEPVAFAFCAARLLVPDLDIATGGVCARFEGDPDALLLPAVDSCRPVLGQNDRLGLHGHERLLSFGVEPRDGGFVLVDLGPVFDAGKGALLVHRPFDLEDPEGPGDAVHLAEGVDIEGLGVGHVGGGHREGGVDAWFVCDRSLDDGVRAPSDEELVGESGLDRHFPVERYRVRGGRDDPASVSPLGHIVLDIDHISYGGVDGLDVDIDLDGADKIFVAHEPVHARAPGFACVSLSRSQVSRFT